MCIFFIILVKFNNFINQLYRACHHLFKYAFIFALLEAKQGVRFFVLEMINNSRQLRGRICAYMTVLLKLAVIIIGNNARCYECWVVDVINCYK